jgi:hypothetical protein
MTTPQASPANASLLLSDLVNNCIREAKLRPRPRPLFGEFWHEGELAVLIAGVGRGKSVLATQIAESIASGRHFAPFQAAAEPKKVGYIDLEKSEKHWEMRYSADAGLKAQFFHKHYQFSSNFVRIWLDVAAACTHGNKLIDGLLTAIEAKIREHDLKVLVLDNITFLKRSSRGTREMLSMMLGLSRLRYELGVSILVLARTPRDDRPRPLSVDEMQSARMICDLADSVFAVGQNYADASGRYVKQLRSRNAGLIYDSPHVPVFTLKKIGGNFLGFEFTHFAPERELLTDIREHREWQTIEQIKQMADQGTRIRDIADSLSLSKTKTHRLLQMWRPPKGHLTAETRRRREGEIDEDSKPSWEELSADERRDQYLKRRGTKMSVPPAVAGGVFDHADPNPESRVSQLPSWIGGVPRPRGGVVDSTLSEISAIPKPKRPETPTCSTTPPFGHPSYPGGEFGAATIAEQTALQPDRPTNEPEIIDTPFRHTAVNPDVLDNFAGTTGTAGTSRTDDPYAEFIEVDIHYDPDEPPGEQPRPRSVKLHKTINDIGKEIFVEKYTEWGQREVWYQINRQGIAVRNVRKHDVIHTTLVASVGSQVKWKPPGQAGQPGQERDTVIRAETRP